MDTPYIQSVKNSDLGRMGFRLSICHTFVTLVQERAVYDSGNFQKTRSLPVAGTGPEKGLSPADQNLRHEGCRTDLGAGNRA